MVTGGGFSSYSPTPQPYISRASAIEALNTLLHHSIYEPSLSLYNLTLVDEYLAQHALPPMENARAYALSTILADIITHNYQRYRAISELPPVEVNAVKSVTLAHIQQDAVTNSPDLMGWAILYYRYIRTEMELSQEILSDLISVSDKTIRRYQSRGLNAFTQALVTEEQQARERVNKLYLQAALPSSIEVPLFSRDELAEKALKNFTTSPTLPVIISGPMGVGKTTLAQEIARRRIYTDDTPELRTLIWIDSPTASEDIFYQIHSTATESDYDDRGASSNFSLLNTSTLIVMDNADGLSDQAIEHCLQILGNTALIITIRSFRSAYQTLLHIPLRDFDFNDAQAYIQYLAQHELSDRFPEEELPIQHIYDKVGGNPLAIRLALQSSYAADHISSSRNALIDYFQQIFHEMPLLVQRVWITLALAPAHGVPLSDLHRLFSDLPATAFFELVDEQIAQYHPDDQRLTLLPVARTSILSQTLESESDLLGEFVTDVLIQLLVGSEVLLPLQIPLLESVLSTVLDFEIPVPDELTEQGLSLIQSQPTLRTPHLWLKLLEWRYRQQPDEIVLGLEFARALRKLQQWERAQLELERTIDHSGRDGKFLLQAQAMLELAILMRQRGAYSQAIRLLERAGQIATRYRADGLLNEVQLNYTQIAIDQANPQLAISYLDNVPITTEWLALRAEAALLIGHIDSGLQFTRTALRQSAGNRRYTAVLQILLGRLYHAQANDRKARKELERAVFALEALNDAFALGRAWMNLGIVMHALGNNRDARQLLDRAASLQNQNRDFVGLEITKYNLDQLQQNRHG